MINGNDKEYNRAIIDLIEYKSSILDLGCGTGELLKELIRKKGVKGRGIDIDKNRLIESIKNGISVSKSNIDKGLPEYTDQAYDYVLLSMTLQVLYHPDLVIDEMLRVGKKAVVRIPNYAYWRSRVQFFFKGVLPKTNLFPYEWYNTPNIHSLTIKDFRIFCKEQDIKILKEIFLVNSKKIGRFTQKLANFYAEEGIFLITR